MLMEPFMLLCQVKDQPVSDCLNMIFPFPSPVVSYGKEKPNEDLSTHRLAADN